ncbi:uncharacterized protein LOC106424635 [Brassica napus]|uniref:uncharacterized protein LOC106424635 n=1 Tax=Brassica napus TaxID=3708 RepID=UPI0020786829|nr:uncharacterized protein LOC106424635 [Brassica napus]
MAKECMAGKKDGKTYSGSAIWPLYGKYVHYLIESVYCFVLPTFSGQRQVKNPFEENKVVGITNYIDLGFELQTRVDDSNTSNSLSDSSLQMAASWQANKNFLLKGKVGALSSTLTLAFKSWWNPSFTFNITATNNHRTGRTACGFGLRVDNLREASYQRADPNFVMLTPNKEHLADGIVWKMGQRPMLQSDLDAENFSELPKELRPSQQIL